MTPRKKSWREKEREREQERLAAPNQSFQIVSLEQKLSTLTVSTKKEDPTSPFTSNKEIFREPDRMVTFEVGPEEKKFLIHKAIACRASPVFDKAFNGNFIEGRTQTYKLPDVDPATFVLFSDWIYAKKLTLLSHDFATEDTRTEEETIDHLGKCAMQDKVLVNLWIMADRFLVTKLQNHVIVHLMEISKICGSVIGRCLHAIYTETMPGSQLRRMVVDQYAWSGCTLDQDTADLPHEMLVDLVILYSQSAPLSVKDRMRKDVVAEEYFVTELDC
ncbi:hypothetical protein LAWI1_G008444 [Lachnellula willkommii]|uniref:BTB domain-containing protein n=1 Tax=Lachnellula willkommii TaxID=215461 RepID=A0A559M1F1_9HELO|nr:hypothetical protein LAWI1_G008444 [Lachnellula willkommii]